VKWWCRLGSSSLVILRDLETASILNWETPSFHARTFTPHEKRLPSRPRDSSHANRGSNAHQVRQTRESTRLIGMSKGRAPYTPHKADATYLSLLKKEVNQMSIIQTQNSSLLSLLRCTILCFFLVIRHQVHSRFHLIVVRREICFFLPHSATSHL
jgi:hypothetical protein